MRSIGLPHVPRNFGLMHENLAVVILNGNYLEYLLADTEKKKTRKSVSRWPVAGASGYVLLLPSSLANKIWRWPNVSLIRLNHNFRLNKMTKLRSCRTENKTLLYYGHRSVNAV